MKSTYARQRCWLMGLMMVLPLAAWAENQSPTSIGQWLDKISDSVQDLDYRGTFVYRCNARLVAMRIVHASDGRMAREQLTALNGPPLEIKQDERGITAILPSRQDGKQRRRHSRPVSVSDLDLVGNLDAHYRLSLRGEDRMAGRQTQVVEILPKDPYRYGYRLWVGRDTGLVLRSDMIDHEGRVIEQMMFTSLELLDDDEAAALLRESSAKGDQKVEKTAMTQGQAPSADSWRIGQVPGGFKLTERTYHPREGDRAAHEHFVFSDGLASVSVFVEAKPADADFFKGVSRMGAVNAFGGAVQGHQVTVVGDVPTVTVQMIGQSVERR